MASKNSHRLLFCLLLAAAACAAGGCAARHEPAPLLAPAPAPAPITETVRLEIYRDIAAKVAAFLRAGDWHVQHGDFYEALANYRAAYAYDEQLEGLAGKIVDLEEKVSHGSARLYERGRDYLATDKERALVAFNGAIRLNHAHAEARVAYDQLREEQSIKAKLAGLEEQLKRESAAYTAKPGELQSLITKNDSLLSYDFENQTALRLAPWIDKEKEKQVARYLAESDKLFAAGKLERTKKLLKKAQALAPENERSQALLKKVQRRQEISTLLKQASDRLRQNDPWQATIQAGHILSLEPKQREARELLSELLQDKFAKPAIASLPILEQREFTSALVSIRQMCLAEKNDQEAERLAHLIEQRLRQVVRLLQERGQALYGQKGYTDAQAIFEYVEELDPGNEVAHTFLKKIENRLGTIESLQ